MRSSSSVTPLRSAPPPPVEMGLADYLGILGRRGWIVALCTVGIALGVFAYCKVATPRYTAEVSIIMETEDISAGTFTSELITASRKDLYSRAQFYATERQLIRSRANLEPVVGDAGLWSRCSIEGEDPIEALAQRTEVEGEQVSKLTMITVEHASRECARDLANAVARTYIASNLERAQGKFTRDIESLTPEIEKLRSRLLGTLDESEAFREEHGLVTLDEPAAEALKKLSELDLALTQAQVKRIQAEKRFTVARRYSGDPDTIESLPDAFADPVVARLRASYLTLRTEYAQNIERYRPKHPTMQRLQARMEQLRAEIGRELGRVVDGLEAEYRSAREQEAELRRAVDGQRAVALEQGARGARASLLLDEARQRRQLFDAVSTKLIEAEIVANIKANNVRVIDAAILPLDPSFPSTGLFTALGLAAGLVLGLTLAFLSEALDTTVRGARGLDRVPVAGSVPVRPSGGKASGQDLDKLVAFVEAERTRLGIPPDRAQVVVVAGCAGSEGATTVAAGLALASAAVGRRVIAVDGRTGDEALTRLLGGTSGPGLEEWIAGRATLQDVLKPGPVAGIRLVSTGLGSPNAALRLDRTLEALSAASLEGDLVIVDAPPLTRSGRGMVLARAADLPLVVVEVNRTRREVLEAALRELAATGQTEGHVVLNGLGKASRATGPAPGDPPAAGRAPSKGSDPRATGGAAPRRRAAGG